MNRTKLTFTVRHGDRRVIYKMSHFDDPLTFIDIKDDGKTVDGPRNATMRAIVQGVNEGRRGLGNIYVWASGDGN